VAAASDSSGTIILYERPPADAKMTEEELGELLFAEEGNDAAAFYQLADQEGRILRFGVLEPRYDRVDELSVTFTQSIHHENPIYPRLALFETYATGPDQMFYRLDFSQAVLADERIVLAASLYNDTAIFTDLIDRVGTSENTLAALFFREDFRHYFRHQGVNASITARAPFGLAAAIGYVDEDQEPLSGRTNGSIFRPRDSFRDNPRATEGRLRRWSGSLGYDSSIAGRTPGFVHRHHVRYETTGPDVGSDFDYDRWEAESSITMRMGPDRIVTINAFGGGLVNGTLPPQERFYFGGLGTLRAQDFGSLEGDRAFLLNVEYAFNVFGQLQAVLFQDFGATWGAPQQLEDTQPRIDFGLGFQNRSGRFRVNLARDLRARRAPLVATVRLSPF
jgi:outer membrane protein assembly factor BamA